MISKWRALILAGVLCVGCGQTTKTSIIGRWKSASSEAAMSDGYTLKPDGTFEAWTTGSAKADEIEPQNRGHWEYKDGQVNLTITAVLDEKHTWHDVTKLKVKPFAMVFSDTNHGTIVRGTEREEYVRSDVK